MKLASLLRVLPAIAVAGDVEIDIADLSYDSRTARAGSLFVSVPSLDPSNSAGSERFVRDAIARGARAVVLDHEAARLPVTTIQVANARAALADIANWFYGHPSRELELFAVTGTDGKTTTSYLLEQILSATGRMTGLIGTVETKIGDRRQSNLDRMTTPESPDVQRLLRRMVDAGVTHVAMEASSHALALERLRGCAFAACALTNITADHVEFHGSHAAYIRAKSRLFSELGQGRPAVLNRDDESFDRLRALATGQIISYGYASDADLQAERIVQTEYVTHCSVHFRGERADLTLPLPGRFNLSNGLAAIGLALAAGLPLEKIAAALSTARPPPGRMERIDLGQPFAVFIDYAHTMHAFRAVLSTLRGSTPPGNRLIAVFGATGNRDRGKRPLLAQIAREYADFFVITNEDPYDEQAEIIMAEIAGGLPAQEEGSGFVRELDRTVAIELAVQRARPGDTVAILGKGHEQSMVTAGRKEPWSDKEAVRQVLEGFREQRSHL